MKYLVILTDGMADEPVGELNNLTPLQFARTPNMDYLAQRSVLGLAMTIPAGFSPGSDVANLSVLGYDPRRFYTGRSPLEAVSMGITMNPEDLAVRCNLVTLSEKLPYEQKTMLDYSAGEISNHEAAQLIDTVNRQLGGGHFAFYPGVSYRNLMIWPRANEKNLTLTPPHDISDKRIANYLPAGKDGLDLLSLMKKSFDILERHPLNSKRKERGQAPANSIWLWGEGRKPHLTSFTARFNLKGSVVAAVDLVKGLGISAGLTPIKVEGATGGIKTDFAGKCKAALDELRRGQDFVYLHIESPDEAGHQGNLKQKIWSIEQIDQLVVGQVLNCLEEFKALKILLQPDHPTPVATKTHSSAPVPFMIFDNTNVSFNPGSVYDEVSVRDGLFIDPGCELMEFFITGKLT
ncbi:MAG: cofactor-independent phosphoglycerate mutase [Syntrophomonadaceae bacterium]|nr:cofactor-independent phosphoglycerate mutase [Syntrophomonadaceae bacterium]